MRAAALLFLVALCPAASSAQTLFTWPDSTLDVAAYTTIEECEAAAGRVRNDVLQRGVVVTGIWRDTMPPDPWDPPEPLPEPVAETVRRCLARFAAADSVSLADFSFLLPLYLHAGWDSKAKALVDRRFAAIGPNADRERIALIDTVVDILLHGRLRSGVQPPRVALAEEIVAQQARQVSDRVTRLFIYWNLFFDLEGWVVKDRTPPVQRTLATIAAIVDSLTERERQSLRDELGRRHGKEMEALQANAGQWIEAYADWALGERSILLDSLRRSTAAYVALRRSKVERVFGAPAEALPPDPLWPHLGKRAPALVGDIWLGRGSSSGPRPTPGRVSLVVFLPNTDCTEVIYRDESMQSQCAEEFATLRRLMERFPALEVTVVRQAAGYFMYAKESITPAVEAELTRQLLASHRIQAAVTMTATGYWRLPDPDGRRIDPDPANRTNYFSYAHESFTGAFLVDEEGIIVHAHGVLGRRSEEEFAELIEVLVTRRAAGS